PIQQAYISFLERSATGLFNILKSFANTKRMIAISGATKRQYMEEFSGKDLENITRVIVSAGNPTSSIEAGKLQMAQDLMAKGMVDLKEYFQVIETGQIDPMIEGPEAENMFIVEENENLRKGIPCVVSPTDNHPLHIKQHNTIMFDTDLRKTQNNPVLAATMQHMLAHGQAIIPGLQNLADPRFLAVLGIQVSMGGAPGPQQPTPQPVSNPMPAGHGTAPGNPVPVRRPVLPSNTPAPTAQAAGHSSPLSAHLPSGAK